MKLAGLTLLVCRGGNSSLEREMTCPKPWLEWRISTRDSSCLDQAVDFETGSHSLFFLFFKPIFVCIYLGGDEITLKPLALYL